MVCLMSFCDVCAAVVIYHVTKIIPIVIVVMMTVVDVTAAGVTVAGVVVDYNKYLFSQH